MLTASIWLAIGICVASALTHLAVWHGPAQRHAHRWFGALCLILVGLLYYDARCYAAPSPEAYLATLRVAVALLFLFWVALAWFCHAYTGSGARRRLWALTAFYAALSVTNLVLPYTAVYAGPVGLRRVQLPWGELAVIATGPLAMTVAASFLCSLTVLGWGLSAAWRQYRAGRRPEARALGVGLGAILLGVLSDAVVDTFSVDWVYMTEFGFVAMALVMNARLAQDWVERQREAQHAAAQLRRSEADLRQAQAVARIGSWRYPAGSHAPEWSDEMYRLLGVASGATLERRTFVERVHPDDRERVATAGDAVLEGRDMDLRCRVLVEGKERWVHVLAQGEVDQEGRVVAILGTTRDITDEVGLETQLFQAQKMEAVGQLAGGVAHDFNNLLQVINGNAELALLTLETEHPAREMVHDSLKAGHKATALVRQLLAFSRRQVLKLADLDLNDVVGGMMKILARAIGEHVRIDFVPGHDLGSVRADRGQLEVVLMNLCVNARDALAEGGVLSLSTENVVLGEAFLASRPWGRPGAYVRLRVTDTGCGMDAATAARVFEPFFTTKEAGHGTGLGLSTVYGVVKQHNGLIELASAPGQGTTVDVYLPRVEARPVTDEVRDPGRPPQGHEVVLVVEDDEGVRVFLRHVLTQAGYRVRVARDGLEALALPEEETADIDLAILDVVLPGRGGRAVYEALHGRHPRLRVLFLSGFSPEASQIRDLVQQGLEFAQKPIAAIDLLRTVRRILDGTTEA